MYPEGLPPIEITFQNTTHVDLRLSTPGKLLSPMFILSILRVILVKQNVLKKRMSNLTLEVMNTWLIVCTVFQFLLLMFGLLMRITSGLYKTITPKFLTVVIHLNSHKYPLYSIHLSFLAFLAMILKSQSQIRLCYQPLVK